MGEPVLRCPYPEGPVLLVEEDEMHPLCPVVSRVLA